MDNHCKAVTVQGTPCGARVVSDGWCMWHAPDRQAQMAEARRLGGQARSNARRARKALESSAMTPAELQGALGFVLKQVMAGKLTPGVGTAVAALARASIEISRSVDYEERLSALEASLTIRRVS